MMNYIWAGIILFAIISAAFNGRISEVSGEIISGSQTAVTLLIQMLGMMCLWSGLIKIADESGLTAKLSKLLSPAIKPLFPGLDPQSPAAKAIAMNVGANILGIGNAATPLGLEAMRRLQEENKNPLIATNHMVTFVVMNTASLQIIPTSTAMMRQIHGSANPMEILVPVIISSIFSIAAGLIFAKSLNFVGREDNRPNGIFKARLKRT